MIAAVRSEHTDRKTDRYSHPYIRAFWLLGCRGSFLSEISSQAISERTKAKESQRAYSDLDEKNCCTAAVDIHTLPLDLKNSVVHTVYSRILN